MNAHQRKRDKDMKLENFDRIIDNLTTDELAPRTRVNLAGSIARNSDLPAVLREWAAGVAVRIEAEIDTDKEAAEVKAFFGDLIAD